MGLRLLIPPLWYRTIAPQPGRWQIGRAPHAPLTSLPCAASAKASCAANVLLPTPPLPDSTSTLCLTPRSLSAISARSATPEANGGRPTKRRRG